jgi:hypothetical protein
MNACLSSLEEVVALWRERKERTHCQKQYCAPFLARCTFAPFTSFSCLLGLKFGHGFFKMNLKKSGQDQGRANPHKTTKRVATEMLRTAILIAAAVASEAFAPTGMQIHIDGESV